MMKMRWVNIYHLASAPKIIYMLAHETRKRAREKRHLRNDDLVFEKTIKVEW